MSVIKKYVLVVAGLFLASLVAFLYINTNEKNKSELIGIDIKNDQRIDSTTLEARRRSIEITRDGNAPASSTSLRDTAPAISPQLR